MFKVRKKLQIKQNSVGETIRTIEFELKLQAPEMKKVYRQKMTRTESDGAGGPGNGIQKPPPAFRTFVQSTTP